MTESYIQLPDDGQGKRLRTDLVGAVHTQIQKVSNSSGTVINPAKEDGNLADVKTELQKLNSLVPAVYDYVLLSYTGSNLTSVVFKTGGASGSVVSTLTLAYTGSNLTSVTKS